MSSALKLQVVLSALDKATAPIRGLTKSIEKLSIQQRESKKQLKQLGEQQATINAFKKLRAETTQGAAALSAQQQKVKELARQMQAAGTPSKALTKEFGAATREAAKLKQALHGKQQQLQGARNSLAQAGISTRNLAAAETGLRSKVTETTKALEQQAASFQRLSDLQKRHAKLNQQHGKEMHRIAMLGGVGAAGVAVGQKVYSGASRMLAPGIAFGEQMSELRAVSRMDADDDRFLKLQQQARDLGASTAFTAADAAAGQTFLARAGFSPEAIHASMQDMLNLALANGMDLARTADIASNISSAFKIDPEVAGNMQRGFPHARGGVSFGFGVPVAGARCRTGCSEKNQNRTPPATDSIAVPEQDRVCVGRQVNSCGKHAGFPYFHSWLLGFSEGQYRPDYVDMC